MINKSVKQRLPFWFIYWDCHEGIWENGGLAACILNLDSRQRWTVSVTPELHYCWGKSPLYLLDRRLGGSQIWYGAFGRERNLLLLPGVRQQILGDPANSLVTILTKLFWALHSVRFSFKFNVGFLYVYSTPRNK